MADILTDLIVSSKLQPLSFIECWAHIPNIMDGGVGWLSATASSLTKVLLASDNVGAASGASALDRVGAERDLDFLENKRGWQKM